MTKKVYIVKTTEVIEFNRFVQVNSPEEAKDLVVKHQDWYMSENFDAIEPKVQSGPCTHKDFKIVGVEEATKEDLEKRVFDDSL